MEAKTKEGVKQTFGAIIMILCMIVCGIIGADIYQRLNKPPAAVPEIHQTQWVRSDKWHWQDGKKRGGISFGFRDDGQVLYRYEDR